MPQFKIIEGTRTMFRALDVNDKQMAEVNAIAQHAGKAQVTNPEMRLARIALSGHAYAPYFIYRNLQIRVKGARQRTWDLSKLRSKNVAFVAPTEQLPAGEKTKSGKKRGGKKVAVTMLPQLTEAESTALVLSNEGAAAAFDATLDATLDAIE